MSEYGAPCQSSLFIRAAVRTPLLWLSHHFSDRVSKAMPKPKAPAKIVPTLVY